MPDEPLDQIRELCRFEGRAAGTDAERRAAQYLAGELKESGRDPRVEPTRLRPAYSLVIALHAVVAIAGTILSVRVPIAGFALVLLAAVSLFGDLTARFHILRMLFPARASQNVTAYGPNPAATNHVVLVAHYDAARSGLIFHHRIVERASRIAAKLPFTVGPIFLLFWTVLALLVCALLRLFGIDSVALTVAQFLLTVPLLASVPLLIDIATSTVVPAANDNASGVAAVLELANRFDTEGGELENLDPWVVLTGGEEGLMLGMRQWVRDHHREISEKPTYFVNIESVGRGDPRYVTAAGLAVLFDYDRGLVELCGEIAGAAEGDDRPQPLVSRLSYDALVPRSQGYPAITITCRDRDRLAPTYHLPTDTPEAIDDESIERAADFCEELVRRLDAKLGAGAGSEALTI